MLAQSSSITSSSLTPHVGNGALRLEQMLPLTLGANIGTTLTGITAAMVADTIDALQVALAHLFFNISGIILFYPVPYMRQFPLRAARALGRATRTWRGFPIVYIIVMFILVPMLFLGISTLFDEGTLGFTVLGSFIVIIMTIVLAYMTYWCLYLEGREKCTECMTQRERKRVAMKDLPEDMEFLKARIAALTEHTGLVTDEEEECEKGSEDEEEVDA